MSQNLGLAMSENYRHKLVIYAHGLDSVQLFDRAADRWRNATCCATPYVQAVIKELMPCPGS